MTPKDKCPVCRSRSLKPSVEKFAVQYFACGTCWALFCHEIDPDIIVTHNDNPDARADVKIQNIRLQNIAHCLGRAPKTILDFGCGRGDFVAFLKAQGVQALGIDQDTELQLPAIASKSVDAINMVEVIEHLYDPVAILRQFKRILKPGGVIYVESSFVDFIGDPAASTYVDPRIGHCLIHSLVSVGFLRLRLGMQLFWINPNSFVLRKQNWLSMVLGKFGLVAQDFAHAPALK